MATLAEIQQTANTFLTNLWGIIQTKEEAYFAKNGTYFGIRWSPTEIPDDGVDVPFVLNRPSRSHIAEDVDMSAVTQVPFSLKIERHNGPEGQGYSAYVRVQKNGNVYERAQGYGFHSTTHPWARVEIGT